jgi:hypothetical protein
MSQSFIKDIYYIRDKERSTLLFLFFIYLNFWQLWVLTLNFVLARQAVYHWNHTSSSLSSGYVRDRCSLFFSGQPGLRFCFMFPQYLGRQAHTIMPTFYFVEMGVSQTFWKHILLIYLSA